MLQLNALSQYHLQLMLNHNACIDRTSDGVRFNPVAHGNHNVGLVYRPTVGVYSSISELSLILLKQRTTDDFCVTHKMLLFYCIRICILKVES